MRLGVFGGTFDPVHQGHLILAEQCREQGRLDRVLFIPAARPPHKQELSVTSYEHRQEMIGLAISGHPAFAIDLLEKDRPGPSYTVDTLAHLQARQPGVDLFLIIGADTLVDLPLWHQPIRILEMAGLLVVARPGSTLHTADEVRQMLDLPESFALRYQVCPIPLLEISSRDLRKRSAEQRSIRYQVPRAVEAYIQEKRLYQGTPS